MSLGFLRNQFRSPFFLIFVAVLLIYPAVEWKIRPAIWHLWNGSTLRFRQYDIPIPTGWVADQRSGPGLVTLVQVDTPRPQGEISPTITILDVVLKDRDLASSMREGFLASINAKVYDRRTVDIDGEQADCDVTNELVSQLPHHDDSIITVQCESGTADLAISSTGDKQNVDDFFSLLSQIRKHRN